MAAASPFFPKSPKSSEKVKLEFPRIPATEEVAQAQSSRDWCPRLTRSSVPGWILTISICFFSFLLLAQTVHADRIGEVTDTRILEQAFRFFSFQDPSLRYALLGCILLGICCGLLGSFIVVRGLALVGDTLSHAVLPGIALGYLWNMSKDPLTIFVGAALAGILGTVVVRLIRQTTNLKQDTALGIVLASFFGIGAFLLSAIQRLPSGDKSGLHHFMFGQAAAISENDVILMAVVTGLSLLIIGFFYRPFLLSSFDPAFSSSIGYPTQFFHYLLMVLLACAVVIALQAVGVVLVSAMLIIPAAAANLLTDRLHHMVLLSVFFGILSAFAGSFFSFLGTSLPTGPFMVLGASAVFTLSFLLAPRHGLLPRLWRARSQSRRIQRENTLKAIYHVLEANDFKSENVSLKNLSARRRLTPTDTEAEVAELQRHDLVTREPGTRDIHLTPPGWTRACEIVRNHRLWELYLTNAAHIAPDHVHDDAERIEHVLGDKVVREIERRLDYARKDPHGKLIPSLEDLHRKDTFEPTDSPTGYRPA